MTIRFTRLLGFALTLACLPTVHADQPALLGTNPLRTDLLIVGGTESGWAAAIQAARMGVPSITIIHDSEWLGGQFTEQALACVDENKGVGKVGWGVDWHPMKRSFHRSGLFKELMDRIEAFNKKKYGSKMPGRPYHGPSTFRPVEAEAIFRQMLQPYIETGQVRVLRNYYPISAKTIDNRLKLVRFQSLKTERDDVIVQPRITIDASDWGDVIQVCGAAYECGPDPKSRYNEPGAPADISQHPPNEMNPITWAMIVEETDATPESATAIKKPDHYDARNYVRTSKLSLAAMRHLNWDRPVTSMGSIPHWPNNGQASPRQLSVFNVRRIADGYTSPTGKTLILLNYMLGQDYPLERLPKHVADALEATERSASTKNIVQMTRQQRDIIFADAKRHALGVLYHLQTFVHDRAADKANSFRRFKLSDEFGTPDHLSFKPYIRESLRLKAMYMMREQDGRNTDGSSKTSAREALAKVMYHDGVLAWQFHYDFHRTGRAYLKDEGTAGPWIDHEKGERHTRTVSDRSVLPLRSLIPAKIDGLIGAQKNVGYSSIVSAAIRLHDQCVHIGQAAGATAAVCLKENIQPRDIPFDFTRLEQVRNGLCSEDRAKNGTPMLLWPFRDLPADHEAFVAVNRLAMRGGLPLDRRAVDFQPDEHADTAWREQVVKLSLATKLHRKPPSPPEGVNLTRGDFAKQWWATIKSLPDIQWKRQSPTDADGDGILDVDDALPLDAMNASLPEPKKEALKIDFNGDGKANEFGDAAFRLGRAFDFSGNNAKPNNGFTHDAGQVLTKDRGFGWSRDVSKNNRQRNAHSHAAFDTFIFTRATDQWSCNVPNGRYRVLFCIGDAGHPQPGQHISIEGKVAASNIDTETNQFYIKAVVIEVRDGSLTIDIGNKAGKSNTCLNWLWFAAEEALQSGR